METTDSKSTYNGEEVLDISHFAPNLKNHRIIHDSLIDQQIACELRLQIPIMQVGIIGDTLQQQIIIT